MAIKLYNTLNKKEEKFLPLKKSITTIYTCGPTVYDYAHTGNFRKYIFDDILIRTLLFNGLKVKHVINLTDVGHLVSDADEGEDKMMKALRREKLEPTEKNLIMMIDRYIRAFKRDVAALNVFAYINNPKYSICWAKATDFIKEQLKLIKKLDKKGFVYQTSDGVYFDTSKVKDYGKLTGQNLADLLEGARVEKNSEKKNHTDFALWIKAVGKNKNHVRTWDSPYGKGFPGWHIECSAMAIKLLGKTIDIHTGGIDHLSIHHPNEIAQSESATGKQFSRFWMHSNFLTVNNEKMSKSTGGFETLDTLTTKGFSPMDYRYFNLTAHYRTPLSYSVSALESARNSRLRLIEQMVKVDQRGKVIDEEVEAFKKIINKDLDTPKALAYTWQLLKNKKYSPEDIVTTVLEFDQVFGLDLKLIWKQKKQAALDIPQEIKDLADKRLTAKQSKDFKTSDSLRDEILSKGYIIEDSGNNYTLKKK